MSSSEKPSGSHSADPPRKRSHPKLIGKYELVRKLGAGGMGAVFMATDTHTNRTVALKVLPKDKAANETLVKRFRSEAQAAANLEHENIVRIYDADEADGYLYIALEYVDGTDVDRILKKRERLPVKRCMEIVKQTAEALDHAHSQNIVHRDIKPSNLMIRKDGAVKLTDLGLARSIDETMDASITREGTTVGTVDYMSPEQARNSRLADIRSDLYSLGCTWYQMLVGHPPFNEGSLTNKLQAHSIQPPPDPRDENPDVPESVVAMIQRLMAKDPEDRYQTPRELIDDLENANLHREAVSSNVLAALAQSEDESSVEIPQHRLPPRQPPPRTNKPQPPPRGKSPAHSKAKPGQKPTPGEKPTPAEKSEPGEKPTAAEKPEPGPKLPPRQKSTRGEKPTRGEKAARDQKPTPTEKPTLGGKSAPPRTRSPGDKSPSRDTTEDRDANREYLVPVAIVLVVVLVAAGLWAVIDGIAGGLGGGSEAQSGHLREDQRKLLDEHTPTAPSLKPEPQPTDTDQSVAAQVHNADDEAPQQRSGPVSAILIGIEENQADVPDWAAAIPVAKEVETLGTFRNLPVIKVGRNESEAGSVASLDAALINLPPTGAVLRLLGDGPFVLSAREFNGPNPLVIAAETNRKPTIVLLSSKQGPEDSLLRVRKSNLTLLGVHLIAAAHQLTRKTVRSVIHISEGNLFLRECSLEFNGTRPEPTAAIHLSGGGSRGQKPELLIDRTVIRGACACVTQDQGEFDMVVSQSLLLPGNDPVFQISGTKTGSPKTVKLPEDVRHLRLVSSTVVSTGPAFQIDSGQEPANPAPVKLTLRNSVVAALPEAGAPLLQLNKWPQDPQKLPRLMNFIWDEKDCRITGWKTTFALSGGNDVTSSGTSDWQAYFGSERPVPQLAERSPKMPHAELARLDPSAWKSTDLVQGLAPAKAQKIGFETENVTIPGAETTAISAAVSRLEPFSPKPAPSAHTVTIELSREDVGARISRDDWPDGTRFLLKGAGRREISPIVVRGKSLTIEFDSNVDDAFALQPNRDRAGGALIDVEGGTLTLNNIRCRLPNKRPGDTGLETIVHVKDGSLKMTNCNLVSSSRPYDNLRGLLRWELTPAAPRTTAPEMLHRHECRIEDSFLASCAAGLDLSLDAAQLQLVNSVVASIGSAIRLDRAGVLPDQEPEPSTLDVRNSTLSAGDGVFFIDGPPEAGGRIGFYCLLRQCVFAPPLPDKDRPHPASILVAPRSWCESHQLFWWENANGYSPLYTCFVRQPDESPRIQKFKRDWEFLWGDSRVRRPLSSRDGVMMKSEYPEFSKLTPASFELHPSAAANHWSAEKSMIGADVLPHNPAASGDPNSRPPVKDDSRTLGF